MRINTKNGTLDLMKREHKTLQDAKLLLLQIVKHGSGDLSEHGAVAAEEIGSVQSGLGRPSDHPGQKTFIEE